MDYCASLKLLQTVIHYSLHFVAPLLIALVFFRDKWKMAWLIMMLTMIIDIDHVFADPIFDPNRCSIGFHFFHTKYAIMVYAILLIFPVTRIIGVGLLLHILTDWQDCLWSGFIAGECGL